MSLAVMLLHPVSPKQRRAHQLLLGLLALGFAAWRLVLLHADPSGPFANTDEQHHITDARQIILHGTPFYDAYNPSVLMPVFTLYELPFLAIFGVNHVGIRIGSVVAVMGAIWLMCRLLQRHGEWLSALLLMMWAGISYFSFTHSRLGIHEPVLVLFSAVTIYCLLRALEANRIGWYVGAFVSALAVPLTKTSGVFIYGVLGGVLLYKAAWARHSVNWRGVWIGLLTSLGVLWLVYWFWFRPHWDELMFLYSKEVAAKATGNIWLSAQRLMFVTLQIAPGMSALALLGVLRFCTRFSDQPQQVGDLDLILTLWLGCALCPLVWSDLWFPRWMMWSFLPLGMVGLRELGAIILSSKLRTQILLMAVCPVAFLVANWPYYTEYYRTMSFYLYRLVPIVEQLVGTNVVSGSGLQDLTYSAKLNIVFNYEYTDRNQDCDEIRAAYATPEKQPQYLGWHVGNDPSKFEERLAAWYAACPEWKAQYKPFMISQRIDYGGSCDIWLVRTNAALSGPLKVIGPKVLAEAERNQR